MLSRRKLLLAMLGSMCGIGLLPRSLFASNIATATSWDSFVQGMQSLADNFDAEQLTQQQLIQQALGHMHALDIKSASFATAISEAYESGNEFWMWQRLLKKHNINGGILNIDRQRMVQLHDHPGATGVLRILSGEAEVWQYDRLTTVADSKISKLQLVSRRILRPGDTAVLTTQHGNIHALRCISAECRMLDFFIPPFQLQQRNWFEPLASNWQEQHQLMCRTISHHEYIHA